MPRKTSRKSVCELGITVVSNDYNCSLLFMLNALYFILVTRYFNKKALEKKNSFKLECH